MPPESALTESRSLRDSVAARTEALDKVKTLVTLPDGLHVTTRMVAEYFEVPENTAKTLVKRHRDELASHGMHTLRGSELHFFERSNLDLSKESYPQGRAHLTVLPRRAVLCVAMLLRDSEVARRVRTYLLDTEERSRPHPAASGRDRGREHHRGRSLDARLTVVESCLGDVGEALRDLGPVLRRTSARLDRIDQRLDTMDSRMAFMDRRLDNTHHVVCAMSERMADMDTRLRELRTEAVRPRLPGESRP
ncbi:MULTISPECIES: hypothetical protein [unclassified Streptomyces]|uniref:hypothetical protein n=1 Tax=unclassified Streptomyces TaxID=2593676 RepID=UPI0015D46C6D|nr:hypothetical protein [Streptomyces sp. Ru87]